MGPEASDRWTRRPGAVGPSSATAVGEAASGATRDPSCPQARHASCTTPRDGRLGRGRTRVGQRGETRWVECGCLAGLDLGAHQVGVRDRAAGRRSARWFRPPAHGSVRGLGARHVFHVERVRNHEASREDASNRRPNEPRSVLWSRTRSRTDVPRSTWNRSIWVGPTRLGGPPRGCGRREVATTAPWGLRRRVPARGIRAVCREAARVRDGPSVCGLGDHRGQWTSPWACVRRDPQPRRRHQRRGSLGLGPWPDRGPARRCEAGHVRQLPRSGGSGASRIAPSRVGWPRIGSDGSCEAVPESGRRTPGRRRVVARERPSGANGGADPRRLAPHGVPPAGDRGVHSQRRLRRVGSGRSPTGRWPTWPGYGEPSRTGHPSDRGDRAVRRLSAEARGWLVPPARASGDLRLIGSEAVLEGGRAHTTTPRSTWNAWRDVPRRTSFRLSAGSTWNGAPGVGYCPARGRSE
jgi:hypothetical protein